MPIQNRKSSIIKPLVFKRSGHQESHNYAKGHIVVCKFWLAGTCSRKNCKFAHFLPDSQRPNHQRTFNGMTQSNTYRRVQQQCDNGSSSKKSMGAVRDCQRKNDADSQKSSMKSVPLEHASTKKMESKCRDECAWSVCSVANLEGHKKELTGIALPPNSDKLYSTSRDGFLHVWDCVTGKCTQVIDLSGEIACLVSEGPWIFVGMSNVVKVWNFDHSQQFDLRGPVGQVNTMVMCTSNDMLFAGAEDGGIYVWRANLKKDLFDEIICLKGHSDRVLSLCAASKTDSLYSGSADHTIRVWDMTKLQCKHTLCGHTDSVTSLICWDTYLFSCSLDQTIKVWANPEGINLEVVYTHQEEHGVLALFGMCDGDGKPTLFRSCSDSSLCFYDLPTFAERGKLYSTGEVKVIQNGNGVDGTFFTGNGTGLLNVWRWLKKTSENAK